MQQLNQSELPFVQWGMSSGPNGSTGFRAFNLSSVDMRLTSGDCAIWTVRSQTAMPHPLHIHVNPFMILNVTSGTGPGIATQASDPAQQASARPWVRKSLIGQWHDTAMVPPFGSLTMKQCYDAGAPRHPGGPKIGFHGKFVFHCHFMVHEDTGLIHNVMLEPSERELLLQSASAGFMDVGSFRINSWQLWIGVAVAVGGCASIVTSGVLCRIKCGRFNSLSSNGDDSDQTSSSSGSTA